jgi:hypothetical protein
MKSLNYLTIAFFIAAISAKAISTPVIEHTGYLPQFETTKKNVKALEENLRKTGELAEILKKGNDELSEAIKQYKQDHSIETKNRIYNLLGSLAGQSIIQIDDIVGNRDRTRDGVKQVLYKMQNIKETLNTKKTKFDDYIQATKTQAENVKQSLRKLAREIKNNPDNNELRRDFRRQLFELRIMDKRYKTYRAHQRLNEKFGKQVEVAHNFFEQLDANTDQMMANLAEQKEFLIMRIQLLRDSAEMERWLTSESESNVSAFAMMKKISELSKAMEKFNAATDVLIEMNDIGTLIDSLPDASEVLGFEASANGENYEDKYIDYFLSN